MSSPWYIFRRSFTHVDKHYIQMVPGHNDKPQINPETGQIVYTDEKKAIRRFKPGDEYPDGMLSVQERDELVDKGVIGITWNPDRSLPREGGIVGSNKPPAGVPEGTKVPLMRPGYR